MLCVSALLGGEKQGPSWSLPMQAACDLLFKCMTDVELKPP